jgi:hypothetical protein
LNSVRFFGVTLDEILLKYDKKNVRDYNDEKSFPVFFKPSFLLNKLVRVLPIKTDDYKKAFLKAVASRGFNKDVRKSNDILRIVNYLRKQGIDEEQIIYSLISEELFLEKYKNEKSNSDFNQGDIIESEINRIFRKKEEELALAKQELKLNEEKLTESSKTTKELTEAQEAIMKELELYKKAIPKLKSDIENLKKQSLQESPQQQINFEAADSNFKVEFYKGKLKDTIEQEIKDFKIKSIRKWRKSLWWNLFWVIPLTTILLYFLFFYTFPYGSFLPNLVIALLLIVLDGIFIYQIKMRYWDEGNINNRKKNIEIPKELSDRLKEAQ